jgi:hypothetical protein
MKLTGKAKELFREYYDNLPKHTPNDIPYSTLMGMSESMQWGAIQDFADSLEIYIGVSVLPPRDEFAYFISIEKRGSLIPTYKTRQEARNAAIKKLNEIINER